MIGHPDKEIVWAPVIKTNPADPSKRNLGSGHSILVGSSGFGKTTLLMKMLRHISTRSLRGEGRNIPALVLDFNDDCMSTSDGTAFIRESCARVMDPMNGIPINPLILPRDPYSQRMTSYVWKSSQVAQAVGASFKLTQLQISMLQTGIETLYERHGFKKNDAATWSKPAPPFNEIFEELEKEAEDKKSTGVYALMRLKPLFINDIFRGGPTTDDIGSFLRTTTIIRLKALPDPELRYALVNFLLRSLYEFLLSLGQSNTIRIVISVDEAHHISKTAILTTIIREMRKNGLALILASQAYSDFPVDIVQNAGTLISFAQKNTEAERFSLELEQAGQKKRKVIKILQSLEPGVAIIRNTMYFPYEVFRVQL